MAGKGSTADYLIVGAGVSGLTLAYYLSRIERGTGSILIVDRDADPDYNISFWADQEMPFQPIMRGTWRQLAVRYGDEFRLCPLQRYKLQAFWRADFDAYVRECLAAAPNVQFMEADVTQVADCGDHAEIVANGEVLAARWVFDSRQKISSIRKDKANPLLMQGLAWEIEADSPIFDPKTAILFDFLLETSAFDFIYVLPYTARSGLVNCAYITPYAEAMNKTTCEQALQAYLSNRLGVASYQVLKSAYGRIPLSTHRFQRDPHSRVVPIGVHGGMVKPTTSYAFTRIVRDSAQIAHNLSVNGSPHYPVQRAGYYALADRRMAALYRGQPRLAEQVMFQMFSEKQADAALGFLDERNSLIENMRLFRAMPRQLLFTFLLRLLRIPA